MSNLFNHFLLLFEPKLLLNFPLPVISVKLVTHVCERVHLGMQSSFLVCLVLFSPQPHLHVPRSSFAARADAVFPDTGTVMAAQTAMMVLMSPLPVVSTTHSQNTYIPL